MRDQTVVYIVLSYNIILLIIKLINPYDIILCLYKNFILTFKTPFVHTLFKS